MNCDTLYICDSNRTYLERLAGYINRKSSFTCQVRTFTQAQLCLEQILSCKCGSGKPAVFIAAEEYKKLKILMEEKEAENFLQGCRLILLNDGTDIPDDIPRINKYQSAGKICTQLAELLDSESHTKGTVITGVYSVVSFRQVKEYIDSYIRHEDKKTFLYIMLEELIDRDVACENSGLSELFYYLNSLPENTRNPPVRLSDFVLSEERADFIPGFKTGYEMYEAALETWRLFFVEILAGSAYPQVIIGFESLPPHPEMFEWMDKLYILGGNDEYSKEKIRRFFQLADYLGVDDIRKKVIQVERR